MSKHKAATKRALSKPKPPAPTKRTGRPKVAARPQRKKQAFIRSPKDSPLRPVAGGSSESRTEGRDKSKAEAAAMADNQARAAALEAILQASLKNDVGRSTSENNPAKALDFFQPLANMQASRAKLLDVAQANMHFAFEFIQRLAKIKSPFEFWAVIAEFTARQMMMIGRHSVELAAFWPTGALRGMSALPGV